MVTQDLEVDLASSNNPFYYNIFFITEFSEPI